MSARLTARSLALSVAVLLLGVGTLAQSGQQPFVPQVGQPGKDVIWVPTSQTLVDKMLDMAKVTPQDYVIDLGSGDGRTVIAAAKRGALAFGIEYEPEMVELSKRTAAAAGVSERASFVNADLFQSDFSKATVITMFLLPSINMRLRPTILAMKPGTRVVSNTFDMADWKADETTTLTEDCVNFCAALLWIVPAKVEGTWQLSQGDLRDLSLEQRFQVISGTLGSTPISEGGLRGSEITFRVGSARYTGRVDGNVMRGTVTGGSGDTWTAARR